MNVKKKSKELIIKCLIGLAFTFSFILSSSNVVRADGTSAHLFNGKSFNEAAKNRAGALTSINTINFESWDGKSSLPSGRIDVSFNSSEPDPSDNTTFGDTSIYMWFDTDTLHVALDNKSGLINKIIFSQDCGFMFDGMSKLQTINIETGLYLDLSEVVNTSAMFRKCGIKNNTLFSSDRPATSIKVMQYMFADSFVKKVDLSGIDTQHVYKNGMANLFKNSNILDEIKVDTKWEFVSKTDFKGTWAVDNGSGNTYDVSTIETEWSSIKNNSGSTTLSYVGGTPTVNSSTDLYEASGNHKSNIWALKDPGYKFTAYCIDKDMIGTDSAYSPSSGTPHGYYKRTDAYSKLCYGVETRSTKYNYLKNYDEFLNNGKGYLNSTDYYDGSIRALDADTLEQALITILYYSKINDWTFDNTQNYIWILTNEFSTKYSLLPNVKYTDIYGKENLVLEIYESKEQAQNLVSLKVTEIFKTDANNYTLNDAHLQLFDSIKGTKLCEWDSTDKPYCISLEEGSYYIHETSAPSSYQLADDLYFYVEKNGDIFVGSDLVAHVSVVNNLISYNIPIHKWNGDQSLELAGAEFNISGTTLEGKSVQINNITSTSTGVTVSLIPGTYVLTETVAPTDYILNKTPINFDLTQDGRIKIDGSVVSSIDIINIRGYDVILSKQNKKDSAELSGASLKLEGISGTIFNTVTWTSASSAKVINLKPGTYRYTETSAPEGYAIADSIDFKLNNNGAIVINSTSYTDRKVVMRDAMRTYEVKIKKSTNSGEYLENAKLYLSGITNEGESVTVGPWISSTSDHIEPLKPGEYTLTEQEAPKNYDIASSIKFKVDMQGKVRLSNNDSILENSRVIMIDQQTSTDKAFNVIISKQTSDGKELKGAALTVSGALSNGTKITDITWTSGDSPLTLQLKPGSYTLTEKKAPEGYNICNAIPFSVDSNGNIIANGVNMNGRINMVDFKVNEDPGNTIVNNYYQNGVNGAGGVSSGITVIKQNAAGLKIADAQLAIYSTVDATTPVAFWVTVADGTFTTPLVPGSYYLREVKAPEGYLTAPDIPFTISNTGELMYAGSPVSTKTIVMIDSLNSGVIPKNIKTGENTSYLWLLFIPLPFIGYYLRNYYKKKKSIVL